MTFLVIAVGRLKDAPMRESCAKYAKRIRHHLKLKIVEVKDGGRRDDLAAQARDAECKAIRKVLPDRAKVVALTRTGKGANSQQFARLVGDWRDSGGDVVFLLGGAHGLAQELVEMADHRLRISGMTLPHELARLVLLEQLYRACTILKGEPYHKGG